MRGRHTRATPAGVVRSRARKTRRERLELHRTIRAMSHRIVTQAMRGFFGQQCEVFGVTAAERGTLDRELVRRREDEGRKSGWLAGRAAVLRSGAGALPRRLEAPGLQVLHVGRNVQFERMSARQRRAALDREMARQGAGGGA